MDAARFRADLDAWLDGELPPARAAEMESAAAADPQLRALADAQRAFDLRVRKAMLADAGSAEIVRRMLEKARPAAPPAGRVLGLPLRALRIAAALLLAVTAGMWWACIPPFECSYMQALEASSHDAAAQPGPSADDLAKRFGVPERAGDAVVALPIAATSVDFWGWHRQGICFSLVGPDPSTSYHVVACDSHGVRPSIRRRQTEANGQQWWIADIAGSHLVTFEVPGRDVLYGVSGTGRFEDVMAAARSLRAAIH